MFELRLIMFLAGFAIIGGGLWHYKHTLDQNALLKSRLTTANATVMALDEKVKRNNEIYERERNAVDEIESAPDSDDGPVAPVLRRTINRMHSTGP